MRATTIGLLGASILLAVSGIGRPSVVHADTVFLKNGSAIDGIMVGRKEGFVLLQIGNLGRMEIPEKDIKHIEKNTRTGYVDPERSGSTKRKVLVAERKPEDRGEDGGRGDGEDGEDGEPKKKDLDDEAEKRVKQWAYDLTRQRTAYRVRAERRLTDVGAAVVPFVLPLTKHPAELTRIATFRIFKNVAEAGDADVMVACLDGLKDEKQFVRKMAWECLRKVSGKNYRFPWDDDEKQAARDREYARWKAWWTKEKKRREKADEAERRVRERAEDSR